MLYGRAADDDGFEDGDGIDAARPAYVDLDIQEPGHRLRGRELIGDGPSRLSPNDAKMVLVVQSIDLDNDSVTGIVQLFVLLQPDAAEVQDLLRGTEKSVVDVYLEAELL